MRGWMAGEGIADRASQPIIAEGWRNKAGELTSSGPGLHSWLAQTLFFFFSFNFFLFIHDRLHSLVLLQFIMMEMY